MVIKPFSPADSKIEVSRLAFERDLHHDIAEALTHLIPLNKALILAKKAAPAAESTNRVTPELSIHHNTSTGF